MIHAGRRTLGIALAVLLGIGLAALPASGQECFRRGDCNDDGGFDIADAIAALAVLFPGAGGAPPPPECVDACDANDDEQFDIGDPIAMLGSLFGGSNPLPPPGAGCGVDPTDGALSCGSFQNCPASVDVHVSHSVGAPGNPGTSCRPVASVNDGIDLALAAGPPYPDVIVEAGIYSELLGLSIVEGIDIRGGRDASTWMPIPGALSTIQVDEPALAIDIQMTTEIASIEIVAANASGFGSPSIAVVVLECGAALRFVDCSFVAGNGAAGLNGWSGLTGSSGGGGGEASGVCLVGGLPGIGNPHDGGFGAPGSAPAGPGLPGLPGEGPGGGLPGLGGAPGVCAPGLPGTQGLDGLPGSGGSGGSTSGLGGSFSPLPPYWSPGSATDGTNGANGSGGGGGGSGGGSFCALPFAPATRGCAGSGGGGGGEGGEGGDGAMNGGASFAALVGDGSTCVFEGCAFQAGTGGPGADGGPGGAGAPGGPGGPVNQQPGTGGNGGAGGDGGAGGGGGGGGGGHGGPSFCLRITGGSNPDIAVGNTFSAGAGGPGGSGGPGPGAGDAGLGGQTGPAGTIESN